MNSGNGTFPPKRIKLSLKRKNSEPKHCIFVSASHFDKRKLLSVTIQSWVALQVPKCLRSELQFELVITWRQTSSLVWAVSQAGFVGLWCLLPLHVNIDLRLCSIYLLNHFCLFASQSSHNLEMLLPEVLQTNMISQLRLQMRKFISSENRGARRFWEIMVNEKTNTFWKAGHTINAFLS